MSFKNILSLVLVSGLFLISCKNTEKKLDKSLTNQKKTEQTSSIDTSDLIGSWEDQSEKASHFTLYADSTAQSDHIDTLLHQKWRVKGNQLYLMFKDVENKRSSIDTTVYKIQKLDESRMKLKQGDLILEYKKTNKNQEATQNRNGETASEQKPKTLSGKLTIGHEVRSFKPCGSDKEFWVSDNTGELKKLYDKLTTDKKPYTPIFAEIEFIDKGKANEGFPADYESVYEVVNILKTGKIADKDCE